MFKHEGHPLFLRMWQNLFPSIDTVLGRFLVVHPVKAHPGEGDHILAANFLCQIDSFSEALDDQIVVLRITRTLGKSMIPGNQGHFQAHLLNGRIVLGGNSLHRHQSDLLAMACQGHGIHMVPKAPAHDRLANATINNDFGGGPASRSM